MNDLILEQKTGFETSLPFQIYDGRGVLFYDDTFTDHIANGERLKFNIPAGVYKYNGSFIKLPFPVEHVAIKLPKRERHIPMPKNGYKVVYGVNPNKCTIYYKAKIITFDNSFKNAPAYFRYGIYFHEIGHHYYKTESKADLYATKKMLDYGFNPSQIGLVGLLSLSENAYNRKEKIINSLTDGNT
jgi:hypothetical protein